MVRSCIGYHAEEKTKILSNTLKEQVRLYYPKLGDFFIPRLIPRYDRRSVNEGLYYEYPKRWMEPVFKKLMESYIGTMSIPDGKLGLHSPNLFSDPVYCIVINRDVRNSMEERQMTAQEYKFINKQVTKIAWQSKQLEGTKTTAITLRPRADLMTAKDIENRYDNLTPELLSVESRLSLNTVRNMLDKGMGGHKIVDTGYIIKAKITTTDLTKRVSKRGVCDWSQLIDTARNAHCAVEQLLRIMDEVNLSIDDLCGIVEEALPDITNFGNRHDLDPWYSWQRFFNIFLKEGMKDTARTMEILDGSIFHGWQDDVGEYV
jgi:hypothetical protein